MHPAPQSPPQSSFAATLGLVFLGGAVGTLFRALLTLSLRHTSGEYWMLFAVNTVGSFALGVLGGWLATRPLSHRNHRLRALIGTGLLGGFTSYSALALLATLSLPAGILYGALSIAAGALAAWFGLVSGRRFGERGGE